MSKDISGQLNRTIGQQSGSAKTHLNSVTQLFEETSKLHDVFSQDLSNLIAEIAALKERVKKNPLELKKFLVDKMHPLEDQLMIGEQNQKQQNKSSQEIMTEIKRQNKQTSESIVKTFENLKHLEIKIGQYH